MEKFNGFSHDEICRISKTQVKKIPEAIKPVLRGQHGGIRRMPDKPDKLSVRQAPKQQQQKTITSTSTDSSPRQDVEMDETNLNRSMSKSLEEALFNQPLKSAASSQAESNNANLIDSSLSDNSSILHLTNGENTVSSSNNAQFEESSILPSSTNRFAASTKPLTAGGCDYNLNTDSPFKGVSLKDFETHRKMIEEQNKQKKQMLYQAIEHHSKKTAAEARKIGEIKDELSKLDNDLALDVAVLRKQIDNACVHFSTLEKQYLKIESQFLKAKIDLHNAAEKKELLTEHLCTVIAHNEDRKAQKLTELMEKVGLNSEDYEVSTSTNPNNDGEVQ